MNCYCGRHKAEYYNRSGGRIVLVCGPCAENLAKRGVDIVNELKFMPDLPAKRFEQKKGKGA